ncbi:hypothetical protein VEE31_17330 [Escherichia coli]|nr:hypothetical protein VEE31_17330 [Escherichia coli]
MRLESVAKFHSPKSPMMSDSPRATASDSLSGTDVMAAMGMAQSQAGFGMAAFCGKHELSQNDKQKAINYLMQFAHKVSGKYRGVAKLEGNTKAKVLQVLATFAYADYCRSAATPGARCRDCHGTGRAVDISKTEQLGRVVEKECGRCKGVGYSRMPAMGNAAVDTTNTMNALNTAIARQERLGTSANQSLLTSLRNLREELVNPATDLDVTFDLLRQHRTAFRSNVQGDAMVFPNQAKAATNMVENAMSKDLRNAVAKNLGASDAAKYLKANSDYANVYNKVLNKNIANKLNKASSEASPELINTVVLSRKPSDVKRIWSALDDKGKDAMRAAYVSKIAEKAGDSPAKFITEVNKLKSLSGGEIYNTIFSGKHMKELDALHEVLQQTARSDTANVVTQTGQSQANRIRTIGATATLGVSMGLEAGFGAMMRLYESKAARNALLRLANTKTGTPAYERALNNAANAIRPILSSQITAEQQ